MIRPHVLPGVGVGADLGDYLDDIPLPPVYAVHDHSPQPMVGDIRAAVRRALAESGALERIEPGMRVGVCAGQPGHRPDRADPARGDHRRARAGRRSRS